MLTERYWGSFKVLSIENMYKNHGDSDYYRMIFVDTKSTKHYDLHNEIIPVDIDCNP